MEKRRYNNLQKQVKKQEKRNRRKRIITVLACVVVFCTTYALILPAITMSQDTYCGMQEHIHGASCYREKIICGFSEVDESTHEHSDACIQTERIVTCGFEESEDHTHDESCYTENIYYVCGKESQEHTHTEACYQSVLSCGVEEHTHTKSCYSDKTADLETVSQWEATLPDELTGIWEADFLTVAESQIGYKESTKNYEISEDGSVKGYTRYGEWYGTPYEDWCAMFVSFCLNYAQIPEEEFPYEANCEKWIEELKSIEKYIYAKEYTPKHGDLVFFDYDQDEISEHVGIVKDLEDTTLKTIEGNSSDEVLENEYQLSDEAILGYGILPEKEMPSRTEQAVIYTDNTYETVSEDATEIIVEGNIPENVQIRAYPTTFETESKIICAYDITIFLLDGSVFEPSDGEHLTVTFKNAQIEEGDEVGVYYIPEEGELEAVDSTVAGEEITFDAEHFSVYAVLANTKATTKAEKDNTENLHSVQAADTSELIRVNLYDYGSNINELYSSNNKYPGFQQDKGTTTLLDDSTILSAYTFNFGNNITSDLDAGQSGVTGKLTGINSTNKDTDIGNANKPISGAMLKTLKDGYPALEDGTSLSYLFTSSEYAEKKNTANINGLFQYDDVTGNYSYNSRENHAQFNAENNTFTLYKELISSNFMMYPFGNFLPFNDITKLSAQASTIDRAYLETIAASAEAKYEQNKKNEYQTLSKQLKKFIELMDTRCNTQKWTAYDAVNAYFAAADINKVFSNNSPTLSDGTPLLDAVYSIDYDEETDFYFGMDIETTFYQPKGGKTGKNYNQDMEFYFTGDDDVWVYIDDVLFLDLSGIHRHVGGKIDFVKGEISYYHLDKTTGDVSNTPYDTVSFKEAFESAYASDPKELEEALKMLNDKGTFQDYSTHSFHFYYMERGAGSGVCRINFNFPLLRQNSIQVQKELSASESVLGNPDYAFQIIGVDENGKSTEKSFLEKGTPYTLYDTDGTLIQEVKYTYNQDGSIKEKSVVNKDGNAVSEDKWLKIDENGVFYLKAGQKAEFSGIEEKAAKYFVRELLDENTLQQYGKITVSGAATTIDKEITIESEKFTGVNSPVKDMSESCTIFSFTNEVDMNKLGKLSIKKNVPGNEIEDQDKEFSFIVTLDGKPLPQTVSYTVYKDNEMKQTKKVSFMDGKSLISIKAGETAVIEKILAGSEFVIQETSGSAEGYVVTYEGEPSSGVTTDGSSASGKMLSDATVGVIITNMSKGTDIIISGTKIVENPNEEEHQYTFVLTQVTSQTDMSVKTDHLAQPMEKVVRVKEKTEFQFQLTYKPSQKGTYYYKIQEKDDASGTRSNSTVYVIEVQVTESENSPLTATLMNVWKDGNEITEKNITFVNTLVGDLTIKKTLGDGNLSSDSGFEFTIELKKGAAELSNSYSAIYSSNSEKKNISFEEGRATVYLKGGESVTIKDLPLGTEWKVTEESGEWKVVSEGGNKAEGAIVEGTIIKNGCTASYINYALYELPETGGIGTNMYTTGGLLLIVAASIFLLYKYKKCRKEDIASS